MKKKDLIDLKNKSLKDLESKAKELKKGIVESVLESKLGKVKNVHETRNKRREIAQVLTFLELKNIEMRNATAEKPVLKIANKQLKSKKEGVNVTK